MTNEIRNDLSPLNNMHINMLKTWQKHVLYTPAPTQPFAPLHALLNLTLCHYGLKVLSCKCHFTFPRKLYKMESHERDVNADTQPRQSYCRSYTENDLNFGLQTSNAAHGGSDCSALVVMHCLMYLAPVLLVYFLFRFVWNPRVREEFFTLINEPPVHGTHLHLVPRPKNEWSYTSTPQYAFMSWCLPFTRTRKMSCDGVSRYTYDDFCYERFTNVLEYHFLRRNVHFKKKWPPDITAVFLNG
jgi:hypothetical protein